MPSLIWKIADRLGFTNASKFRKFIAQDRAAHPDEFARADEILTAFHSGGGLTGLGVMQPYKLASLERYLNRVKPKSILEIGSGSSTVVFAQYAKETGARVVSVDESGEWVANTKGMLAKRGLSEHVEFRILPKRLDTARMEASYDGMPKEQFDLVLIDGPSLQLNGQNYVGAACVDIFALPLPPTIVVDMRAPTVAAISERLGDKYIVKKSDVLSRKVRVGFQYFSVFERT